MRREYRSEPVGRARGEIETMRFGDDDAWIPRTWVAEVGSDELTELRKLERRLPERISSREGWRRRARLQPNQIGAGRRAESRSPLLRSRSSHGHAVPG